MRRNGSNSLWTVEKSDAAERMWFVEKLSAGMIGKLLGMTRNAIIGKIDRIRKARGLEAKPRSEKDAVLHKTVAHARKSAPKLIQAETARDAILRKLKSLPLGTGQCRYIDGEPRDRQFCCRPVVFYRGRSTAWCQEHFLVCIDVSAAINDEMRVGDKHTAARREYALRMYTRGDRVEVRP